jgi:hypothetical protein
MQNETQSKEREAEKEARRTRDKRRESLKFAGGLAAYATMIAAFPAAAYLINKRLYDEIYHPSQSRKIKMFKPCKQLESRGQMGEIYDAFLPCEQLEAQHDTDGNGKLNSEESRRLARAVGYEGTLPDSLTARVVPGTHYLNEVVLRVYENKTNPSGLSPDCAIEHKFSMTKLKKLVKEPKDAKARKGLIRKTQNRR